MLSARNQSITIVAALAFAIGGCASERVAGPVANDAPDRPQQPVPLKPDTTREKVAPNSAFIWSAERGTREIAAPVGYSLWAERINDSGEVAGVIMVGSRRVESFIWSEAEGLRRFGSLSGFDGGVVVTGINSAGTVVGYQHSFTGSGSRAFSASAKSGLQALADEDMWVSGINQAGTIVRNRRAGPFRMKQGSGFEWLAARWDGECTVTTAINDAGEILGWSGNELFGMGCVPQAWIVWRGNDALVDIATCPLGCALDLIAFNDDGLAAGNESGGAVRMRTREAGVAGRLPDVGASGINNRGDVSGTVRFPNQRPVVWTIEGAVVDIPLPPGRTRGTANAINSRGEVVGSAW